jgi:hypothetical protein
MPPPWLRDAGLTIAIRNAGYPCETVNSVGNATGAEAEDFRKAGLDPSIVRCSNHRTYPVGVPRRTSSAQPRVREIRE